MTAPVSSESKTDQETPTSSKRKSIKFIYADGSFRPPHCGAWAYVVVQGHRAQRYAAEAVETTSINQMELRAILNALKSLPSGETVVVRSDSMYCVKALSFWWKGWKKQDWITAAGEPVKNRSFIEDILAEVKRMKNVSFQHVYGHKGDKFNEFVDTLAQVETWKMRQKWLAEQPAPPQSLIL